MDGFTPMVMEARPPYLRFEVRAVERRKPASEGGTSFYVDEIFALITPHGSKDTTEKVCSEYFPKLAKDVKDGNFPVSWYNAYLEMYHAYKNDQEPPLHGTSVKNWPSASPAEVKILVALRCLTVEDLAQANEELAARIGMGARSLIQRAKDYLVATKDHGPLVAQLSAMRATIAGLETRIGDLTQRNIVLEQQLQYRNNQVEVAVRDGLPPVEDRLQAAQALQKGPSEESLIEDAIEDTLA
jgi:hypothetical protein